MENLLTNYADEITILLMGLTMALVGGIRYARQSKWLNEAKESRGRITALEKVFVDTESHYGVYERPLFRYNTTHETKVSKINRNYAIGELKVGEFHPVLYNHRTPGKIALKALGNSPANASFFLFLSGLVLSMIALALF
jgi:hypothetical protein